MNRFGTKCHEAAGEHNEAESFIADWIQNQPFVTSLCDKNTNTDDKADVLFVCSTNAGTNWSSPRRVNTVWTNDQWMPALAVKPDGTQLFVAW